MASLRSHPNADQTPPEVIDALLNTFQYQHYQYETCDMHDGWPSSDDYFVSYCVYPEIPGESKYKEKYVGEIVDVGELFKTLDKENYKPVFPTALEERFLEKTLPKAPNTYLFKVLGYQLNVAPETANPKVIELAKAEILKREHFTEDEFTFLAGPTLPEMPDDIVSHVGKKAFGPHWQG
jgi:hypothetical protein